MHMPSTPIVSVLLSTHNGEAYLRQALDSMAAQTYSNWEWVLVDNASTDATPEIFSSYESRFPGRIRRVRNRDKLDLADSLNRGLELTSGRYVARMDDDDLAHPDRLMIQVREMERDPELVLSGTAAHRLHEASGVVDDLSTPGDPVRLRIELCWHNPFMHASVIFRRILHSNQAAKYPTEFSFAEDYGMWAQLARVGRIKIIPKKLMTYRKRSGGMTGTGRGQQLESTRRVSAWYTREFTAGTPLDQCRPEELREWIEKWAWPDSQRLERVQQVFAAASRSPYVTRRESRKAVMNWAEPFLDHQKWSRLFASRQRRVLKVCGCHAGLYLFRRMAGSMNGSQIRERNPNQEESRI